MNTLTRGGVAERRSSIAQAIHQAALGYASFTDGTASYPSVLDTNGECTAGLLYASTGIGNEVGELAEIVAPSILDPFPALTRDQLAKVWDELGDCQWYVARIVHESPLTLTFGGVVGLAADLYFNGEATRRDIMSASALSVVLAGHAGRIQGVVKKMMRDGKEWGIEKRHAKLMELQTHLIEFVARSIQFAEKTAPLYHLDGGYIGLLRANVQKLDGRKERGTLHGDGNR